LTSHTFAKPAEKGVQILKAAGIGLQKIYMASFIIEDLSLVSDSQQQ
jgi:hypothetical protein